MALEYSPPERLGLAHADLPRSAWPRPRRHFWPFGATSYHLSPGSRLKMLDWGKWAEGQARAQ